MSVSKTLEDREKIYGRYDDYVQAIAEVTTTLKKHHIKVQGNKMSPEIDAMISDLIMKLVRFSGCPQHLDNIHDLVGYSTLVEQVMKDKHECKTN